MTYWKQLVCIGPMPPLPSCQTSEYGLFLRKWAIIGLKSSNAGLAVATVPLVTAQCDICSGIDCR
jgi:hypothetical protein